MPQSDNVVNTDENVFNPDEGLELDTLPDTSQSENSLESETINIPTSTQNETVTDQPLVQNEQLQKSNASLTEDYSTNIKESNKYSYKVSLPSINLGTFSYKLNLFNKIDLGEKISTLKKWRTVNEESIDYYTVGGLFQDRFYDEKSKFSQGVETKSGELKSIDSLKFKQTDGEIKGELAVLKVSKMLGLGDVINIPLPHSGIWVTIKPPTERDLIDFYNSIFKDKIILGRATFGLTLSNFSVYINNKLFDFIVKHIHSVNFKEINKNDLKNYILIHDFPILAWGFGCTIYPNGFDYQRACINDIESCDYIAKATINMTKLLWVDNSSLSEAQKVIMSENRPNKLELESYRKYIAEHVRTTSTDFTTKNGIKFKFKIPTFNEFVSDGFGWIDKINSSVDSLIIEDSDPSELEKAKTELLDGYVKSSILRKFNHFIDFIELPDGAITDRDTINKVLEVFSSDDELRNEITTAIMKFKSDTTLALIGIPEYKCPNCGMPQNPDPMNDKLVNVIPLDVMNLFFTLITLRISRITEREV